MSILIIAEHGNNLLKDATLSAVTAGAAIGGDIDILIAGHNCSSVVDAAQKINGVSSVLVCDSAEYENFITENIGALINSVSSKYSYIIAPSTINGKAVIPFVGALLDVQPISDITSVVSKNSFVRPTYAGNAMATVETSDDVILLTTRVTSFELSEIGSGSASVVKIDGLGDKGLVKFVSKNLTVSDRPELTTANTVVSGGRGVGSKENFAMIEGLADKLNAAVGASRAAVDAGYSPNDTQVGQTGKVVAPDLYIAIGISGAIQHIAGMASSKYIVAINNDSDAPIFEIADYGLVADLFEAVPELDKSI